MLKNYSTNLGERLVTSSVVFKYLNETRKNPFAAVPASIYKTNLLSVQIVDSTDPRTHITSTINGISSVFIPECEMKLREYYKMKSEDAFIFMKLDYDPVLDLTKSTHPNITNGFSVEYEIYIAATKTKIDREICKNTTSVVSVPMNKTLTRKFVNIQNMLMSNFAVNSAGRLLLNQLDITTKDSPLYNDICLSMASHTGIHLTRNEKRKMFFPNVSIDCGSVNSTSNCDYDGLTSSGFAFCACNGIPTVKTEIETAVIEALAEINIYIIKCYAQIFTFPFLFANMGFYVFAIEIILMLMFLSLAYYKNIRLINRHMDEIIHNDCFFLDEEEFELIRKLYKSKEQKVKSEKELIRVAKKELPNEEKNSERERVVENEKDEFRPSIVFKEYDGIRYAFNKSKLITKEELAFTKKHPPIREDNSQSSVLKLVEVASQNNKNKKGKEIMSTYQYKPTRKDLKEGLKTHYKLTLDKRSNFEYFWDHLVSKSEVYSLLFNKTLMTPYYISLLFFFNKTLLIFALNAIFFQDDEVTMIHNNDRVYLLTKALTRVVISQICSKVLGMMTIIPLTIPARVRKQFNFYLKKTKTSAIRTGYKIFLEKMKTRYIIFYSFCVLQHLFSAYYIMCFFYFYKDMFDAWLSSSIVSFIVSLFTPIALPLAATFLRIIARKYEFYYLLYIEKAL